MCSETIRHLTLSGHVGFDSLPRQTVNKCLQGGFAFNILCVGETGIGKSTLISSLFNMEGESHKTHKHTNPTVSLKTKKYDLKEKEVPLRLSVTETVGYGDQINREGNFEPILSYVDSQFEKYFQEELKLKRNLESYRDTRIHVCLYFIPPSGHYLKASDLLAMKYLSSKVNVVPLIAKADVLTKIELENFKSNIRQELQKEKIKVYQFQDETEEELKAEQDVPLAVVGSTDFVVKDGKHKRGRSYSWGTICIDNEDHSDFVKLRQLLIEFHMEDLTSLTHTRYYENYRNERFKQCGFEDFQHGDGQLSFIEVLDAKIREQRRRWKIEEEEVAQSFRQKLKNFEKELFEEEQKIKSKYRTKQDRCQEQQKILDEEKMLILRDMDLFTTKKRESHQRKKSQNT